MSGHISAMPAKIDPQLRDRIDLTIRLKIPKRPCLGEDFPKGWVR